MISNCQSIDQILIAQSIRRLNKEQQHTTFAMLKIGWQKHDLLQYTCWLCKRLELNIWCMPAIPAHLRAHPGCLQDSFVWRLLMAPAAWQKSPLALTVTAVTMALMLGVPQEMYLAWLKYILIYPDDFLFWFEDRHPQCPIEVGLLWLCGRVILQSPLQSQGPIQNGWEWKPYIWKPYMMGPVDSYLIESKKPAQDLRNFDVFSGERAIEKSFRLSLNLVVGFSSMGQHRKFQNTGLEFLCKETLAIVRQGPSWFRTWCTPAVKFICLYNVFNP